MEPQLLEVEICIILNPKQTNDIRSRRLKGQSEIVLGFDPMINLSRDNFTNHP